MNNCSRGPLLDGVREASERYLTLWDERGMDWDAWMAEVEAARAAFARLIGAEPDAVAVVGSVSHATAAVAGALDWSERSTVVASRAEFPTVGQIWLARERMGVRVQWVEVVDGAVPVEGYRATVDEDTAVVSACHGYYQTGAKQDLGLLCRIAHEAGALLYVDAYQTLGTHPIDVQTTPVDMLASGTLKYLMGSPGIAFLYIRPEVVEKLHPTVTGWFGQANPFAFEVDRLNFAAGARRFDSGTPPVWNAYVARAGMEAIEEIGVNPVHEWTTHLSRLLIEGGDARGLERIGPSDPLRKTPSTAFRCSDSRAVEAALRERGVLASARGPAVRLAPHFYTTEDEVEKALDELAEVLREQS